MYTLWPMGKMHPFNVRDMTMLIYLHYTFKTICKIYGLALRIKSCLDRNSNLIWISNAIDTVPVC